MNIAQIFTDYLDGLANSRLALRSPSVLVPFLVFGLLQMLLLSALAFFDWPPIAPLMLPVVRALGGDAAIHYPAHFALLPRVWDSVYLPLVATIGFSLWTLAVWVMVGHHEVGRRVPSRRFRALLPGVIGVGVVFVGVSAGLGRAAAWLAGYAPAGNAAQISLVAAIALVAVAQSLLVYAPVVLRIRGVNALSATVASVRYALRNFWPTVLVVATVLAIHAPLDILIGNSDRVAVRFHPEMVYVILLGSIALEMITAYLLFASVVGLALPEEGGLR
ncbi:MAG TPA: hypothetical protein VFX92_12335 [Candidatus Krumholzibacteria bacterium]|nr:hypothetical protein [Candidatus Krumholzibacteria bacterium]